MGNGIANTLKCSRLGVFFDKKKLRVACTKFIALIAIVFLTSLSCRLDGIFEDSQVILAVVKPNDVPAKIEFP